MKLKKISPLAIAALGSMEIKGSVAYLHTGTLDRAVYQEVDRALKSIGGKWNRKVGGHVFESDPTEAIDELVLLGGFADTKTEFGFFATPAALAATIAKKARVDRGMTVLEPSAGTGALAQSVRALEVPGVKITCIEIQQANVDVLKNLFSDVIKCDFLSYGVCKCVSSDVDECDPMCAGPCATTGCPSWKKYDRVVMNPPFAKQADLDHVTHALKFLKLGGVLVSVMSAGVTFRTNKKTKDFLHMLNDVGGYTITPLPDNSFKASGTNVRTVLLTITRLASREIGGQIV